MSRRVTSSEIPHSHDELQTTAQSWLALRRQESHCHWLAQLSSDNDPDLTTLTSDLTALHSASGEFCQVVIYWRINKAAARYYSGTTVVKCHHGKPGGHQMQSSKYPHQQIGFIDQNCSLQSFQVEIIPLVRLVSC